LDETADGMEEAADEAVAEAADEDMEEGIEISESELEAMYNEGVMLEVEVSKGFKDMARPHEFGAGVKGQYQSDPANLADYANGEKEWDSVEPPAKQDFTVKEIRAMVRKGIAENRALAAENAKLRETAQKLAGKLSEMNLLNSKILHVNKFLAAHRLNNEQKRTVIESIDKGSTVKEVKRIYSVLESSFKAAGAVTESAGRRPRADAQKRRTSGAPNAKVLRESVDAAEGGGFDRWKTLAGLKRHTNG
jgi:hypothetical protein